MSKKKIVIWSSIISLLVLAVALVLIFGVFKHEHKWSEWQTSKVATCTQDGINIRVCDDCGESQNVPISAIGHTWSEWSITKEAFCTQDGSKERICYCGEKESQTISALGHTFSAWNTTKEATCTVKGSKERSCSCGEKEVWATSALGHNFSAWNITKEATCLVNGSKERTCSCGEKEVQKIVASGHTWKNATCTEAKTCRKCGLTDGSALGHTTQFGICNRCGNNISATMKCSNNLPQSFRSHYSSGRTGSTTQITDVSFEESGSKIIISVKCKFLAEYHSNDAIIAYTITDPNGDIIESWRIDKYQCVSNLVFTETISFTPTMAGEYIITFYDFYY